MSEVLLALFMIGFGLSVAGLVTHLYQGLSQQRAALRADGATLLAGLGHLLLSLVCGPYLLLQMGARTDPGGTVSPVNIMLAAFIAFGWSFVTGLVLVGSYAALRVV